MLKSGVRVLTIALLSLTFLVGCDKDDDVPAKTKTQLLTQDLWKFDKATAGGTDASSLIAACIKDNNIIFDELGTGEVVENSNLCTPATDNEFVWTFQNNESRLFITTILFPGGGNEFTIINLNETTLELSQQMIIPPAPATTVTISLKH